MSNEELRKTLLHYTEESILAMDHVKLMQGIGKTVVRTLDPQASSENISLVAKELRAEYADRVQQCLDPLLQNICYSIEPYIRWHELAKALIHN